MKMKIGIRPSKPKTNLDKLQTVIREVKNWPLLVVDKFLGSRKKLLYRFRNGLQVICRSRSTDINEAVVVLSGIEYPQELCKLPAHAVVLDIGSNIGTFGIYLNHLNRHTDFMLHAFEPFPDNAALTEENFKLNGLSHYCIHRQAISGSSGTAQFDISGQFDAMCLNDITMGKETMEVETITLSAFCRQKNIEHIRLLKMDIEGSEFDVFRADAEFICRHVDILFTEYHFSSKHRNVSALTDRLVDDFDVILENTHTGGGMIIARRKHIG